MELYNLQFQERKFNQSKETPVDFLTDLTRLSNIAFAASGGNDYSAERTRRIRDAFTSGMPTHIRLKLLMQPETTTVNDPFASVTKRLTFKSTYPDEDNERELIVELALAVLRYYYYSTFLALLFSSICTKKILGKTQNFH